MGVSQLWVFLGNNIEIYSCGVSGDISQGTGCDRKISSST